MTPMRTIPDDICKRVEAIMNATRDGHTVSYLMGLAAAAERNRCARIVEQGLGKTNTAIARAIRDGDAA